MTFAFKCQKCKEVCIVDGEYPKFFCYCDECRDYAEGFDCLEFAADYMADLTDYYYDQYKDGELNGR